MNRLLWAALAALFLAVPAQSQSLITPCVTYTYNNNGVEMRSCGGYPTKLLTNLNNTAVEIKPIAGMVAKLYCYNPIASAVYVQFFDAKAANVTVGTTTPKQSYGIPASSSSGFVMSPVGDWYATAISVAATTTATGGSSIGEALTCNVSYN